jgi:HK97 family phage major capsid protein
MINLTNLRKDRAAAKDAMDALLAKAENEKRMLDSAELKEFDEHEQRFNDLTETLTRAERSLKIRMDDPPADKHGKQPSGAVTGRVEVHNNEEDRPYGNFGEFLAEVRSAAISPAAVSPRLQVRAALGANEKVGVEGGFLVGKDAQDRMLEVAHDVGILTPRATEIPISAASNGVTINGIDETSRANGSRWGGVQVYHADEAGTTTATKPKFRQIELKLKKLFGLFYATDEVLADSATLGSLAERAFGEEMSFKLDDVLVSGNGAGQGLGILNSPGLVSVAKETGQAAASVVSENISKMWQRMLPRARSRAAWFINSEVEPQLDTLQIGTGTSGQLVYMPPGGLSQAPYGTMKGRPVIVIEQASALGTVGDIILADWSYYLLATKGGLQTASSMHVQFLTGEQVFRFTYRYDGQPSLAAPITPYKGSATQGPFVVLANR